MVLSHTEQHHASSTDLDTSDVESIDQKLRFATVQLREHYQIEDESPDSLEGAASPSPQLSSFGQASSEDNEYMTPLKEPTANPSYDQDEIDVEDPLFRPQQKPNVLSGGVYFNFRDNLYRTLKNNEVIDSESAIYHVGQDQCYYFSSKQIWKSLPFRNFPPETVFYWYRSGPLQIPNWPKRSSLLTPSTESPHVSFPNSAFKPVQTPINPPTNTPVAHLIPLQQPPTDQHRLFYGELTSQNLIPKHQYWSNPPERFDLDTPIPTICHISVENASGESMGPLGGCKATISLGNKRFTHDFIVCKKLTSSLVLGLDFSSHFQIGTDWTSDG